MWCSVLGGAVAATAGVRRWWCRNHVVLRRAAAAVDQAAAKPQPWLHTAVFFRGLNKDNTTQWRPPLCQYKCVLGFVRSVVVKWVASDYWPCWCYAS